MSKKKVALTQGFIDRLVSTTRQKFQDEKVPGLILEVMPSGSKYFRFRKEVNGKEQTATIGRVPFISLENARIEALKLASKVAEGVDLASTRQAAQDELTLGELAAFYFDQHAKEECSTAKDMQSEFTLWFKSMLDTRVSALTTNALQIHLNRLATGHHHRANKARNYIRAIFNWGIRQKLVVGENPLAQVKGYKVVSRARFVQPHEVKPLLEAIRSYPDARIRDCLLICWFTGARSGNVMSMRWDEVNLDLETWTIPITKNGETQVIPLSEDALKVLKDRYKHRGVIPWVFPGGNPQNKRPCFGPLTEPKKAWKKIIAAAGITDLRIHDLRRTMGSYLAMSGANTATIQKALGHRSMAAASIYQRMHGDPVRQAANLALSVMDEMAKRSENNSKDRLSSAR